MRPLLSLSRITLAVAAIAALCGLVFLVYGVTARPYTEIEAQIVFQVSRIQHHLPLYTDPAVGAWETGAPPSRFNVLYPPLWVELLACFPTHSLVATCTLARVMSVSLFLFALVAIVRGARPENRQVVLIGALLTLGLDMIVRGAGLAVTDVPAIALSTLGLVRANRKGRLDVASAALLALAPFVKHAVVGITVGAFAAHLVIGRKNGIRAFVTPLLTAALTGTVCIGCYHWLSGGVWLQHIVRATGQPLSFERWQQEFGSRVALLGLPHAVVLVLAVRRRAPLLAVFPFAAGLTWTVVTLAKHGSTTHYWIEPTLACLVTLGTLPPRPSLPRAERSVRAWRALGLALALAVAASSIPAFATAPKFYAQWQPLMTSVRRACALSSGQIAMAADVRVEVEIDGRVIIPTWESSFMVRADRFPVERWREDLLRLEVGCLVTDASFFDPLPSGSAGDDVHIYRRELRDAVEATFLPVVRTGPFLIWRRRPLTAGLL